MKKENIFSSCFKNKSEDVFFHQFSFFKKVFLSIIILKAIEINYSHNTFHIHLKRIKIKIKIKISGKKRYFFMLFGKGAFINILHKMKLHL